MFLNTEFFTRKISLLWFSFPESINDFRCVGIYFEREVQPSAGALSAARLNVLFNRLFLLDNFLTLTFCLVVLAEESFADLHSTRVSKRAQSE